MNCPIAPDPQDGARSIRRLILETSFRLNIGHVGSNLCVADILAVLYGRILRIPAVDDPDRDRFILSKGHAGLALHAALYTYSLLDRARFESFQADGSDVAVHPESSVPGIDFSTGSLGMGLSFGAGAALAARLGRAQRRVHVLLSDAECNEGAVWEAAAFARHRQLGNLIATVDVNGQQALGFTEEVLDLSPLAAKWESFGWHCQEVDGHAASTLESAYRVAEGDDRPSIILAQTQFGKGAAFMRREIKWHYLPLSEPEFQQALAEVESS